MVAAADTLHRAVPATSVKIALTSGAHTLAALKELAAAAERAKLHRPIAGVKFLPPIPDPSKFFCVGKNNKKHREELAANKMLTEVPNEPTGFIKLIDTMSGDGDEVASPPTSSSSITSRSFATSSASVPMASRRPRRWTTSRASR